MPTINNFNTSKVNFQWISELAKTINSRHLHLLLLNTIRDISRTFMLSEKEKMHRIRSITEAYDAWQNQTRQSA